MICASTLGDFKYHIFEKRNFIYCICPMGFLLQNRNLPFQKLQRAIDDCDRIFNLVKNTLIIHWVHAWIPICSLFSTWDYSWNIRQGSCSLNDILWIISGRQDAIAFTAAHSLGMLAFPDSGCWIATLFVDYYLQCFTL